MPLGPTIADRQPLLRVQPVDPLVIDRPPLASKQRAQLRVSRSSPQARQLPEPPAQHLLVLSKRSGSDGSSDVRGVPDTLVARSVGTPRTPTSPLPVAAWASPFFPSASLRIVRSRLRSATSCLSLRFSSRSCRSSRSSVTPRLPNC